MKNQDYLFSGYVGEHRFENSFSSDEEMKASLTCFDFSKNHKENEGGMPFVSDGKVAYIDKEDYHTLILGSTGSLKTRALILPTIYSLALSSENMIISDPKSEIYDKTAFYLKKTGYEVYVLNLRDLKSSHTWNPLLEGYRFYKNGEMDRMVDFVADFMDIFCPRPKHTQDPYWSDAARNYISGCIYAMMMTAKDENEVNLCSLTEFISIFQDMQGDFQRFKNILLELPYSSLVRQLCGTAVFMDAQNTRAGILGQVATYLEKISYNINLAHITASSEIDLHALSDEKRKIAIYLLVPDEKTTMHFMASAFVKQAYEALIDDASKKKNNKLKRRVNFLLDEFANMPRINDMPNMITAARSRNIRFFLVVQSDAQLKTHYGEDAETIKTNCLNWVFLNSKEVKLMEQVCSLTGYVETEKGRKPLLTLSDLSQMRKVTKESGYALGVDALILLPRYKPYLSFLPDISQYDLKEEKKILPLPHTEERYVRYSIKKRILSQYGLVDSRKLFVEPISYDEEEEVENFEDDEMLEDIFYPDSEEDEYLETTYQKINNKKGKK